MQHVLNLSSVVFDDDDVMSIKNPSPGRKSLLVVNLLLHPFKLDSMAVENKSEKPEAELWLFRSFVRSNEVRSLDERNCPALRARLYLITVSFHSFMLIACSSKRKTIWCRTC